MNNYNLKIKLFFTFMNMLIYFGISNILEKSFDSRNAINIFISIFHEILIMTILLEHEKI